jgi:hypothetical protein
MLENSQKFHLQLSHMPVYVGSMVILTIPSILNIYLPLRGNYAGSLVFVVLFFGMIMGLCAFFAVKLYKSPNPNFMRLMKLCFGMFFILHLVIFFTAYVRFSINYGAYWFAFSCFLTTVLLSFIPGISRSQRLLRNIPFFPRNNSSS